MGGRVSALAIALDCPGAVAGCRPAPMSKSNCLPIYLSWLECISPDLPMQPLMANHPDPRWVCFRPAPRSP